MPGIGRNVIVATGIDIQVSADGSPLRKIAGLTVDWATIAAVGADTVLASGWKVPNGQKYMRYGQILTRIGTAVVQTVSSTATGGTFVLKGVRPDNGQAVQTAPIAFNATAAQILAALQAAFSPFQVAGATGGALPGTPVVVTFGSGAPVAQMTVDNTLATGGTVTVANTTPALANDGKYGPYDSAATDGRQNIVRGLAYILNKTVIQNLPVGIGAYDSDNPPVIEGGLVWFDRLLIATGGAAHSLALGPTQAEFEAAFPSIRYARANS